MPGSVPDLCLNLCHFLRHHSVSLVAWISYSHFEVGIHLLLLLPFSTATMTSNKIQTSPGNDYSTEDIKMKIPHMEFIYRLDCEMAKENHLVGAPFGGTNTRMIMPIVGGTVKGPKIDGTIQHMSGADWGTMVKGTDVRLFL